MQLSFDDIIIIGLVHTPDPTPNSSLVPSPQSPCGFWRAIFMLKILGGTILLFEKGYRNMEFQTLSLAS